MIEKYDIVLIAAVCLAVILLQGCSKTTAYKVSLWGQRICDGRGSEKPDFSNRDYYTLVADALNSRNESVLTAVLLDLGTSHIPGTRYTSLMDAYIEGGRDKMVHKRLRELWRKAKKNTKARYWRSKYFAQLKMRQYLWAHPESAEEAELHRFGHPLRGWWGFAPHHMEFYAKRLITAGDKEFQEVWKDYQWHLAALRAETLIEDESPDDQLSQVRAWTSGR